VTVRLVPGQNLPWPDGRITAYADDPEVRLHALLLAESYRVRDERDLVDAASGERDGVTWLAGPPQGITMDLAVLSAAGPEPVARVLVVGVPPGSWGRPPRVQLLETGGSVVAEFTPADHEHRSATVLFEAYRGAGGWRVRAVGRGYGGGLQEAAAAHGLERASGPPEPVTATADPGVPGTARVLELARMILDDASRTTASVRSTAAFAAAQLERDLEQVVADPALRTGPAADAARARAQRRHDDLVSRAAESHGRDLAQLTAELADLERVLPPSLARWGSGRATRPSDGPPAVRLGELSLDEAPEFRLPILVPVPMPRQLWVDTESGGDAAAHRVVRALVLRILLALGPMPLLVSMIDVGGARGALGLPPALLAGPPATDAGTASRLLADLVEQLDVLGLAVSAGAVEELPPERVAPRLLVVTDVPTGLGEAAVHHLHRLVTHGPALGFQVLFTGSPIVALELPALALLQESCLRLPSAPGGDLVDGFGGVDWTFVPDEGPDDRSLDRLLSDLVAALG